MLISLLNQANSPLKDVMVVLAGVRYVEMSVTLIQQGFCRTAFDRESL